MKDMTEKQRQAYDAIIKLSQELGHAPIISEIGNEMGVSGEVAYQRVLCVEKKGYIRRGRGPRAITILK